MGSYSKAAFTGTGEQEVSIWYALLLSDAGEIQALEMGSAGGRTGLVDTHLASYTRSTLKIVPNKEKYYPIEVTYIESGRENNSSKSVFSFSEKQAKYIEKKMR
jgi:hypothetical protein